MATDLLSSAFANFVGQRRAVCYPVHNEQKKPHSEHVDTSLNAFPIDSAPSATMLPTSPTSPSPLAPLLTTPTVFENYETSPPPLKRLRTTAPSHIVGKAQTRIFKDEPTASTPSVQPPPIPMRLPPLTNSIVPFITSPMSTDTSQGSSPRTDASLNLSDSPQHALFPQKRKISSSALFSPPLAMPSTSKLDVYALSELAKLTEAPVNCKVCNKSFSSKEELKIHKKVHVRNIACYIEGCSASFSKANHLSRHIRIVHNKERPFACGEPGCGSRFGSKSHLGDHIRAVHMRLRTFKCPMCDASWSKRCNLQKHIRIRHLGLKPYRCALCDMSFGTLSHVKRHELTVHKKPAV